MKEFLKKYWGIVLTIFGAIFAVLTFQQIGKNKEKAKQAKKTIKDADDKLETIVKAKDANRKEAEDIKNNIKTSSNNVAELEKEVDTINNTDADVEEAIANLHKIGKQ